MIVLLLLLLGSSYVYEGLIQCGGIPAEFITFYFINQFPFVIRFRDLVVTQCRV